MDLGQQSRMDQGVIGIDLGQPPGIVWAARFGDIMEPPVFATSSFPKIQEVSIPAGPWEPMGAGALCKHPRVANHRASAQLTPSLNDNNGQA